VLLGTARDLWDENARVLSTRDMLLGEFLQWRERARRPEAWSHGAFDHRGAVMQMFKPQAQSRRLAREKHRGSLRLAA